MLTFVGRWGEHSVTGEGCEFLDARGDAEPPMTVSDPGGVED